MCKTPLPILGLEMFRLNARMPYLTIYPEEFLILNCIYKFNYLAIRLINKQNSAQKQQYMSRITYICELNRKNEYKKSNSRIYKRKPKLFVI